STSDIETIIYCHTLEEVILNENILKIIIKQLKCLPKLRLLDCFAYTSGNSADFQIHTLLESINELIFFDKSILAPSEQHVWRIGGQSFELIDIVYDCIKLQTVGFPFVWVTSGYVNLHELYSYFKRREITLTVICFEGDASKSVSKTQLKELDKYQDVLKFKFSKQNLDNEVDYEVYKLFIITLMNSEIII
ncbi:uncharacterized protein LOC120770790, partial [Bactrocera tryoni]|uniref:uncharacterized protein LOC120770790 n=1 Tax=Bactrocera tryoni TaxID=59916 RepID=UPI001A971B70